MTGEEIANASGIPERVVVEKMGVCEKHVCPSDADPPLLESEDTLLFLAAGTGYTWAATVLDWLD